MKKVAIIIEDGIVDHRGIMETDTRHRQEGSTFYIKIKFNQTINNFFLFLFVDDVVVQDPDLAISTGT